MFFILIYDMTCIRLLTQILDGLEYVFKCVWTIRK